MAKEALKQAIKHSRAATYPHTDGEALINSAEWLAQTRLSAMLFVVLLLTHGCLTENVMRMGEVSMMSPCSQAAHSAGLHSQQEVEKF